jgi:hypothetical protein
MANYLDSRRIQVTSSEDKPSNIEVGTIVIETDTPARYWYDGNPWNKSLYDLYDSTSIIARKHFVEWFTGASIDTSVWTQSQSGTGTYAMADEINGGFTIYPASSNTNYSQINFGNKRHFDPADSVLISVFKQATNNGGATTVQMVNTNTSWNLQSYGTRLWVSDTYFVLRTADASTVSNTDSSITQDTSFHNWKFDASASDIKLYIDGVLEVTKTTNKPTATLQPMIMSWNENGNRDVTHVRYLEVYNKS